MKSRDIIDIFSLSIPERIQLVEDLWDTIAIKADEVTLTQQEKEVIDQRLEAYRKNPMLGSPWKTVFQNIIK